MPGGFDLFDPAAWEQRGAVLIRSGLDWYLRTPPGDRMIWAGLAACGGLALIVLGERLLRLRPRRIIPADFTARFVDRLHEGKLDGGKALDYCEMNPSPAARVALAAVRRWGRPAVDLERAVALAHRVVAERLRRNVGTLRRVAALAPLLGLLGTLIGLQRVLTVHAAAGSSGWGPAVAAALSPLIAGVATAALSLVAYDMLFTRIERLGGELDRLGAETIDAIAMSTAPAGGPLLATSSRERLRADVGHPESQNKVVAFDRPVHVPLPPRRRGDG
jgi:biopolymer transport protein ExbB